MKAKALYSYTGGNADELPFDLPRDLHLNALVIKKCRREFVSFQFLRRLHQTKFLRALKSLDFPNVIDEYTLPPLMSVVRDVSDILEDLTLNLCHDSAFCSLYQLLVYNF